MPELRAIAGVTLANPCGIAVSQSGKIAITEYKQPDKDYSVFYNIAAKTFNNTTKDETLWILINGKLEGHRYNLTSKKNTFWNFHKELIENYLP